MNRNTTLLIAVVVLAFLFYHRSYYSSIRCFTEMAQCRAFCQWFGDCHRSTGVSACYEDTLEVNWTMTNGETLLVVITVIAVLLVVSMMAVGVGR